jgi:hypothetical protein
MFFHSTDIIHTPGYRVATHTYLRSKFIECGITLMQLSQRTLRRPISATRLLFYNSNFDPRLVAPGAHLLTSTCLSLYSPTCSARDISHFCISYCINYGHAQYHRRRFAIKRAVLVFATCSVRLMSRAARMTKHGQFNHFARRCVMHRVCLKFGCCFCSQRGTLDCSRV